MKEIRFGFIGAGKIAHKLAEAISHVDGAVNYAVAARDLERAESFKARWDFKKAYGNYEEMLQDPNVDAVYINTIHSLHYEHCLLALKYNKPVICEKSLTTSLKDTIDLYKKFEEKNLLFVEALWTSFQPFNNVLLKLLFQDKVIGNIKKIKTFFNLNNYKVPRIKEREMGGGAILDLGIYSLSFIFRILGEEYNDLKIIKCKRRNGVDIFDRILLTYPNNVIGIAEAKVNAMHIKNSAVVYGDKGYIKINSTTYPTEIKVYSRLRKLTNKIDCSSVYGGYTFEIKSFINALNNKQKECEQHTHKASINVAKIEDKIVNG